MCEMAILHLCLQGAHAMTIKPLLAKATQGTQNLVPFSRVYTSQSELDDVVDEYQKEQVSDV
jgi:hypothetical protein